MAGRGSGSARGLLACASVVVAAAVAAWAGGAFAATEPGVRAGFAHYVAFDGGRVAWIDSAWALRTRSLDTGAETKLLYADPYKELIEAGRGPWHRAVRDRLVFERGRLYWVSRRGTTQTRTVQNVFTATPGAARRRLIGQQQNYAMELYGGVITGIAADDSGLTYGVVVTEDASSPGCFCEFTVSGGMWSTSGNRPARQVAGVPPVFVVARGGGRVAVLPAKTEMQDDGRPLAADPLEIRDARSGSVITTIEPGRVHAVALSDTTIVLLVGGRFQYRDVVGKSVAVVSGGRIERYTVSDGSLLGSTRAPERTVAELDLDGDQAVFRTTSAVMKLDVTSGRISTVATAPPWQPAGVGLDDGVIAWVETKRVGVGDPSRKNHVYRIKSRPARGA